MNTTDSGDIFIGIGANLDHPDHGTPLETCEAAVVALEAKGISVTAHSGWFKSAPVPASDQPWFINAVVQVETALDAGALMALLHEVEADFGRVRGQSNAARTLDLDLLDYAGEVSDGADGPILPHPRMMERAFVLIPLYRLAPAWKNPKSGQLGVDLIASVAVGQQIETL